MQISKCFDRESFRFFAATESRRFGVRRRAEPFALTLEQPA